MFDSFICCEFKNITYKNAQSHTTFINLSGLVKIISVSSLPVAVDLAKKLGLRLHQKMTRIEIDIVLELNTFFECSNIRTIFQYKPKDVKYSIDYYVPDFRLAIEIDEWGHKNRDLIYELKREMDLKKILKCKFIRCNPDDPNFSMGNLFGRINKHIRDFPQSRMYN